jgi:hypothetical protein
MKHTRTTHMHKCTNTPHETHMHNTHAQHTCTTHMHNTQCTTHMHTCTNTPHETQMRLKHIKALRLLWRGLYRIQTQAAHPQSPAQQHTGTTVFHHSSTPQQTVHSCVRVVGLTLSCCMRYRHEHCRLRHKHERYGPDLITVLLCV